MKIIAKWRHLAHHSLLAGSRSVPAERSAALSEDKSPEILSLPVEGEALDAAPLVTDVASTALGFGISPCASIASRAAFSLALFALSNTSSCTIQ